MPKIVFWNIQRGAGRVRPGSEGTDKLNIVLESIAAREKPNLFILCEGQSSAGGNLDSWNKLPTGYSLAQTTGGYRRATTLQYVVMTGAGTSVTNADLACGHNYSRPAQFLRFQSNGYHYVIAALHAASVTRSQTAQMNQTNEVFEFAGRSMDFSDLHVIIGDMNMDVSDGRVLDSIFSKQDRDFQRDFNMKAPAEYTHTSNGGRSYDKVLDWAWVRNSITGATIRAIQFEAAQDIDRMDMDDSEADEEWMPQDDPGIKSDHLPILLSW